MTFEIRKLEQVQVTTGERIYGINQGAELGAKLRGFLSLPKILPAPELFALVDRYPHCSVLQPSALLDSLG
jgi:hypothetical protein